MVAMYTIAGRQVGSHVVCRPGIPFPQREKLHLGRRKLPAALSLLLCIISSFDLAWEP